MTITGMHHVALKTSKFAEMRAFYRDILKMPEVGAFDGRNIVFLEVGQTTIELIEGEPDTPVGAIVHFALEVDDIDATAKELKEHGIVFHVEPQPFPDGAPAIKVAFFRDPDGNDIELVQPLDRRYPAGTPNIDITT